RSTNTNDPSQVQALLDAVPPYFSQAVISSDRKTANLAFGIRLMPLDEQKRVIDDLRAHLNPPAGVTAGLAGLPVLAADANHELSSTSRRAVALLAGILAVFLVLLAIRRRVRLAAVPLIPIALATGWSAALLFLLRIPLNPMSAALGALVIAISTEFSVLLSARYAEERDAGWSPRAALERTYGSTGAAVLASGTTAIAGFAALIASDIRMLPVFAAPLATGPYDADANVKTKANQPGRTMACHVREPGVVNICELRRKPVVMTFMFTRLANCAPQMDRVQQVQSAFPGVNFLG